MFVEDPKWDPLDVDFSERSDSLHGSGCDR
jgi:hypothetical protein